jgi:TRAP-type C4-dicarboxylate transport system permease small subunit
MLPPKFRQIVLHVNVLLIFSFSATMTYQGVKLIDIASSQTIPEMGIPMAWIYFMIPAAGILLMLTCVEMVLKANITSIVAKE